jgi:prepilin-type N-terminal cleavage/methylation domain-containing protein
MRKAFTLVEMLIVVAIITLIVMLAVPAFNVISGNRSINSAQNQLAAIIGRTRQEAIGLQDYRGVILFQDVNTGRACAAEVYFPTSGNPLLDLTPTHDELLLPTGISFRTVEINAGYLPMNIILFNNRGEFVAAQPWTILTSATGPLSTNSPPGTALGLRVQNTGFSQTLSSDSMPVPPSSGYSAFGFVVFPDETAYQTSFTGNVPPADPNHYLTDTGITFLVNKYNGTLLRSE